MIKIWYEVASRATFAMYGEVKLRFFDRKKPWEDLDTIIDAHYPEGRTGTGRMEVPYSDKLWNALLAEGEVIDDN